MRLWLKLTPRSKRLVSAGLWPATSRLLATPRPPLSPAPWQL